MFPCFKSSRTVAPTKSALSFGRYVSVSSKVVYIFLANFKEILLANPGVKSDSCMIVGIFKERAAITTGTLTKPPFEKSKSGFCFLSILRASKIPFKTLKTSFAFSKDR
ncbi:hypothetical protein SETU_01002 [Staphylococcus epidermidis]|nr:hypothetical protein SETU_01002 [Staphylococcus epidermidis]